MIDCYQRFFYKLGLHFHLNRQKTPKRHLRIPKFDRWQMFTLGDFRLGHSILVMTISSISMHQNRPISCFSLTY